MILTDSSTAAAQQLVKLAIAGLSHDHVHGAFQRLRKGDVVLVGIAEADKNLAQRYRKKYYLPDSVFYKSLPALLKQEKPDAVLAFNPIAEHLSVVEACAPLGIHVMVEKPLATSVKDARRMAALAWEHNINLLTNYETTWYGSNQELDIMAKHRIAIGDIRRMTVHAGHQGLKEVGASPEFVNWLTDPAKSGGGAMMDFGCYGVNLMTWLMQGKEPLSVTAITRQLKPEMYPDVDDDATIILEYPEATGIIEASWNWPFPIKDLEVFGETGYIQALDEYTLRTKTNGEHFYVTEEVELLADPYQDYVSYLVAMIKGEIQPDQDLSSLENNLMVVRIMEAARESAREGKKVLLK
ncbi:Gfo/Idh/MocA family protein [Pontibacter ruber]|uniref:Gfo/Idh/MocA family protein n=1 Tax=Pontibacter ruber TaxID=1343895 RepID=A0ABW5D580_9BACT|nr:Gfo/Idh/MocA family oxidoreductase [Pontibacter ruber]